MIFLVRDIVDSERDAKLVKHVFMNHANSVKNKHNNRNQTTNQNKDLLEIEFLRK